MVNLTWNLPCDIQFVHKHTKNDELMKMFAFTGTSDSGKTRLIKKLVGELKTRGHVVSVIKHCAHGFDLEDKGKDSAKFMKAGSDSVCMYSPDGMVVFQHKGSSKKVWSRQTYVVQQ